MKFTFKNKWLRPVVYVGGLLFTIYFAWSFYNIREPCSYARFDTAESPDEQYIAALNYKVCGSEQPSAITLSIHRINAPGEYVQSDIAPVDMEGLALDWRDDQMLILRTPPGYSLDRQLKGPYGLTVRILSE